MATPDELRSRGTDRLYVALADAPAATPEFGIEGVLETDLDGDTLVVTATGGGRVAPSLLRELEYAGHEVVGLDIRRASLEEVFVDMTRLDEEAEELGVVG